MTRNHSSNDGNLQGQVALVTGGGRGLGRAFALALASAGARVVVVARSAQELEETVALVTGNGGQALAIPADVTDQSAVTDLVAKVEAELGPIDLLINNAGLVSPIGPFWETDPEEWWRTMDINLRGIALFTRAVLPGMVTRRQGRIINLASGVGTVGIPYGSAYVTSKTAVIRFTETVALETKEHGVQIFSIDPGTVRTAMTEYLLNSPEGQKWVAWFRSIFEEGRNVPAEHAAELVLRLASGEADRLSGRFISVHEDLELLLQHTEKIDEKALYTLRVQTLAAQ